MKWLIRTFIIVLVAAVVSNSVIHTGEIFETRKNTVNTLVNTAVTKFSNNFIAGVMSLHYKLIMDLYKVPDFEKLMDATVIVYKNTASSTGVCIGQDENHYYVITASHTVTPRDDNNVISIGLRNGITVAGEVIKEDIENDLALIKITKQMLIYLEVVKITEDIIRVGDTVYAIGHPLYLKYALTKGVISTLNHPKFTVSNITLSYGNSGGGLFNINGELIGINVNVAEYLLTIFEIEDGDKLEIPAPVFTLAASVKLETIKEFLDGEEFIK